ncbi:MAG: DUF4124 domain-containing protein [Desulfuromonadaceae bacterium]
MKIMMAALMLAASPAQSMVYMWRDSAGIAHYTNKEYDVPVRYKAKVKVLYPEASDSGAVQSGAANAQAAPAAQPPAITNQIAGPAGQPVTGSAAPVTQIKSTTTKTPERRGRRKRERSADEDE